MDIAVIGLGRMGRALARRLLAGGASVTVWNRSAGPTEELASAGARVASSVAGAWETARVAMSFLADDRAVESVVCGDDGLLAGAPPESLLVEMSTISLELSAQVAVEAAQRHVAYLRCPVSGNPDVLSAGNLLLIVSGSEEAFAAARPALELVAGNLHHVGQRDEARLVKLAVNAVLAATTEMVAETVTLCEAAGIDRATYLEVLSASAVGSPFISYKRQALIDKQYAATFTTAMLDKDLRLALDEGRAHGVPLPVTELIEQQLHEAAGRGLADRDILALLAYLQMRAGQEPDVPVG